MVPFFKPDFAIKTPISYTKTGEINFPYDTKAHCYKLANGQKIIIVPQEGETVLRTYVNTGSMNEPDKVRGISHYIEHNLFNGSKGLENGEFFKEVDKMGANTNASTGFAETNYYISSNLLNKTDLENKIKLHASMLESPLFAIDKLEKEKGIVNSEINMIVSDPNNLAMNKMIKNLYNIKSTSTDLIGGTTDNITALTREEVVNYYNNNYYPANMVTVITGEIKPDETIELISKYFNSKRVAQKQQHLEDLQPLTNTVREDIISDKATATTSIIGFNGPASNNSKDRIYTEALLMLLTNGTSSRTERSLKQFSTQAVSYDDKISSNPNDGRTIIFSADSTEANSEKILKTIFNEIGNIKNNPPTEQEMKIIKKEMLKNFSNTFEQTFFTNNAIGTSILENNLEYFNQFETIINNMTAQDLVNTANKYLDINKASVSVVHPASSTNETIQQNYNTAKNISFTGKKAINTAVVKEYNTNNNYRIITNNSKTDNIEICFKINTDKEPDQNPSASIILSDLLNKGTKNTPEELYNANLAQEGINKSFAAGKNNIACAMGCDSTNLSLALSSINEVLQNPRFTEEEFEQTKQKIKDKILTSEKSAFDKLSQELYKGSSDGISKEEILKDLETVTIDDIKKLYLSIINNVKGTISISAHFNKKPELKNELFSNIQKFSTVKPFTIYEPENKYNQVHETKVLTDIDFKNQAEIIEAFNFRVNGNIKDETTMSLLNIILGGNSSSRLFNDLRENQKLAYHVKSQIKTKNDIGTIALRIGTTTENKETGEISYDNLQKSINGFNKHIQKIKSEKVTEEELNSAKLYLKNTILNNNSSAGSKTNTLLLDSQTPYGINKTNLLLDEIDKITADDIYNAANYIFAGKPVYSIVATENTLKANKEYLKQLNISV